MNAIAPDVINVDMASVESNLVYINVSPPLAAASIMAECGKRGVRVLAIGPQTLRAVCHHQVSKEGALRAVEVMKEAVEAARAAA